jgi:hypothetical protein
VTGGKPIASVEAFLRPPPAESVTMKFRELLVGLVLVWLAAKLAGEAMERIG